MPRIRPVLHKEQEPLPQKEHKPWAITDNTLKGPWTFRSKEVVQCVCEGGRACRREDPKKQQKGNAIPGLHCNWVGKDRNILAMARPWQSSIQHHHIVDAFVQHNFGMVLNLQEVGEHSSCGPGNLPKSGFTYDPDTFMAARIAVYNFSWRDMGVPDLEKMMDIVQVMEHVVCVEGRKVAVHCHAGLGRTGLAIACSLVFSQHYTARRAVSEVRQDRPGALQTSRQEMFVYIFEQYLAHLRCLFPPAANPGNLPNQAVPQPRQPTDSTDQPDPKDAPAAGHAKPITETHPCGLVIVRPAFQAVSRRRKSNSTAAAPSMSPHDLGLDQGLPWNQQFDIQPDKYNKDWVPHPPRTYQEALYRQQRLLHGPARRTFRHVHRYVSQAILTIIEAARSHPCQAQPSPATALPGTPGQAYSLSSGPPGQLSLSNQWGTAAAQPVTASQPSVRSTALGQVAANELLSTAATTPGAVAEGTLLLNGGSPTQSAKQRPQQRLRAWACCTGLASGPVAESVQQPDPLARQHAATTSQRPAMCFATAAISCAEAAKLGNWAAVTNLGRQPAYARFTGGLQADALAAQQQQQQIAANYGDMSSLPTAPVAVVIASLHHTMMQLTTIRPALSETTLAFARDHYTSLPYHALPIDEVQQFAATHKLLNQLPAADQEILLLFTALLRHMVQASGGSGCEEAAVQLCQWVLQLLVGGQLTTAPQIAHEALTSLLWYLLCNDVAFATLVLLWRRRRMSGPRSKPPAYVQAAETAVPPMPLLQAELPSQVTMQLPGQTLASSQLLGGLPLPPLAARALQAAGTARGPQNPASNGPWELPPLRTSRQAPASLVAPPLQPPPVYALTPAPAGYAFPLQAPASGAHSVGPDDLPDARLYGPGGGLASATERPSLKQQLASIPTVYIPPTTPGSQQMTIHDVWM